MVFRSDRRFKSRPFDFLPPVQLMTAQNEICPCTYLSTNKDKHCQTLLSLVEIFANEKQFFWAGTQEYRKETSRLGIVVEAETPYCSGFLTCAMYKCDLKLFFCRGKNVRFNLAINSGCVLHFLPLVWRLKVKDCNFPPKFSYKKRLNWIYFIWTFFSRWQSL